MTEKQVELYLDREIKKLGGFTRKWVSPNYVGVPDRIIFMPRGLVFFVEVKSTTGRVTVRQQRELETIRSMGVSAHIAYGKKGVDQLINWLRDELNYVIKAD